MGAGRLCAPHLNLFAACYMPFLSLIFLMPILCAVYRISGGTVDSRMTMASVMRGWNASLRCLAQLRRANVVTLNDRSLCSTDSMTNGDISAGAVLTKLTRIRQRLEFAIEGAHHMSASANLSFLERDPTQRGPRAQFERDAAVFIRNDISAALRDVKREISARGNEHLALASEEFSLHVQALKSLVRPAEEAIDKMRLKIVKVDEKLNRLERGGADG